VAPTLPGQGNLFAALEELAPDAELLPCDGRAPERPTPVKKVRPPQPLSTWQAELTAGALFCHSHSGGKDSQVSLIELLKVVPKEQVLVIHATLGRLEWPGALELARDQAAAAGVPFLVVEAVDKEGARKELLGVVRRRFLSNPDVVSWPSQNARWCTSELKSGPIKKAIRAWIRHSGHTQVVEVLGIRAQESPGRARQTPWSPDTDDGVAKRRWHTWLNIHDWTEAQVFAEIAAANQTPHPAYALGNRRLSCLFCFMAHKNDLQNAAEQHPEVYREFLETEAVTGYTFHISRKPLDEIVGFQPGERRPDVVPDAALPLPLWDAAVLSQET